MVEFCDSIYYIVNNAKKIEFEFNLGEKYSMYLAYKYLFKNNKNVPTILLVYLNFLSNNFHRQFL